VAVQLEFLLVSIQFLVPPSLLISIQLLPYLEAFIQSQTVFLVVLFPHQQSCLPLQVQVQVQVRSQQASFPDQQALEFEDWLPTIFEHLIARSGPVALDFVQPSTLLASLPSR